MKPRNSLISVLHRALGIRPGEDIPINFTSYVFVAGPDDEDIEVLNKLVQLGYMVRSGPYSNKEYLFQVTDTGKTFLRNAVSKV